MRRGLVSVFVLCILLVASIGMPDAAQWDRPDLLVTPDVVEKNITKPDWVVIDCRDIESYTKGHIPGAISMGKPCSKALRDSTSRIFHDASKYEKILGKLGIDNDTHVVTYGDAKTIESATVAFWVLEYLGHDGKTHLLNGGLDAWTKAGKKLATEPTIKPEKTFQAKVVKSRLATSDEMLQIANGVKTGIQVIDARTKGEYEGGDIRALRGGHIPHTTINVSHIDTRDHVKDPETGKDIPTPFMSPDRVAKYYESLDKNKRTIAYCQTGTRSTQTYLQLRLLGYKEPANYDDSWVVWGSHFTRYPVENEQWFDFARVKELEGAVKAIQEKLKAMGK